MQTTQISGRGHEEMEQASDGNRGLAGQTKKCTRKPATEEFLNQRFLPRYVQAEVLPDQQTTEGDFFASLNHLSSYYGFKVLDVSAYPYPYNLLLSYQDAQRKLRQIGGIGLGWKSVRDSKGHRGKGCLFTCEEEDFCEVLYYVPVYPLYLWLQDASTREMGNLLLSVFAFLHHAGLSHYCDGTSEVNFTFELLEETLNDDYEHQELAACCQQYWAAKGIGRRMLQQISKPRQLKQFPRRVAAFVPDSLNECIALDMAKSCLAIYQQYPDRRIFDHVLGGDRDRGIYHPAENMGFVFRRDDWMCEDMEQYSIWNKTDCQILSNPVLKTFFGAAKPLPYAGGLDFEARIMGLLQRLIFFLNQ